MSEWKPRLGVAGAMDRQKRVSQWTRSLPEARAVQLPTPPPPCLHMDPATVGARGTVPSMSRLIDLPQFRLRRRSAQAFQCCQVAADRKSGGLTPPGTSTKRPTRAFRLRLTGRFSSDNAETTKRRPILCEQEGGKQLNTSSNPQKVEQRPDQKLIVTNPRVRRYRSTEAFREPMEEKTKDDTRAVEKDDIPPKRRSLPFRPFLWRKREKSENETPDRPNKRSASKCKPLQRLVNRKRISLPPVLKMNVGQDEAARGDKVVKTNPKLQSPVHLLNTEQTSTNSQSFRYVHIQRQDENTPFGIFVRKGKHGFVVTRVPETYPLRLGDEIVEINGSQCPDMSLSWLVCHLQSSTSIHARVLSATTSDHIQ